MKNGGRGPGGASRARWPGRSPGAPIGVLAHRGGAGVHPENSLAAFADALRLGADGVELDVRRSADGAAVVHHDAVLADGRPLAEVVAADLPGHVATLEAALATCAGAMVDVEIKNSPADPGYEPDQEVSVQSANLVAAALGRPGAPAGVLVSSFFAPALSAVRDVRPELATGLLVHPAFDAGAGLDQAAELGCTAVLPFVGQVTADLVSEAHRRALAVVVWTVNEEADLRAVQSAGADAVVTDRVARALVVLGRR